MHTLMTENEVTAFANRNPSLAAECIYSDGKLSWPNELSAQMEKALDVDLSSISLSQLKIHLKAKIDAEAENERLKYITPGNGQAMTYQQKVDEARAFKAAASPQSEDYPVLSSEIGITGPTLADVADTVLIAFSRWQQVGAAIESVRLGSKRDVDEAENEVAARAVLDVIAWPKL
ncbi:hypothetical protein OHI65_09110 [Brucella sp. MAB-22]|uniref:hypothetical protein n=1 Tax=Brucella sp. MAB-22 TaxID=2986424 RepID=UPI00221F90A5|nr:hypothetical protein [Brucella sp. MAB-22]UYT54514.1 hypothetical protein OHI65_09110 [Brucella sp. MAB-22]